MNVKIKRKIRTPILMLIIIVPLITLLLFNICIRFYTTQEAKKELQIMSNTIETVVKREFSIDTSNLTSNRIEVAFQKLYKAMKLSKLTVNTEILLYNQNQELLYPSELSDSFLSEDLIGNVAKKLPQMEQNKVKMVQINGVRYNILCYQISNNNIIKLTLVFISQTNQSRSLLIAMNIILISIMLLGALLASIIVSRISSHVSEPVTELTELTRRIGGGDFSVKLPEQPGNILEINQLYQSIQEMTAKLSAYDQTQKTFLQNASHELRTPLMSIQGYAEGIENGVVPDVIHAAEIISAESKRLNALVDELLTLSRIEAGIYHDKLTMINLNNIIQDYLQRLTGYAKKLNRKLELKLSDIPINVMANDTLLSQAINNIVSNCLHYAKTTVNITLVINQNYAVIRIFDDGNGIPDQDLPHIFQRFYKGAGGNFGLGLAIAKSSIELMNGKIDAYNSDIGAVFELWLPTTEINSQVFS